MHLCLKCKTGEKDMNEKLNVVFMGTPDFGIPSVQMLMNKHNLIGVFCQPDKINGRNNLVTFCPIKQFAVDNNIPVYQPTTFKDNACVDILQELNPDIIVVAAYGKILPKYVLDFPKYGCINIHGSLLPAYRGASPIQSSILNGDKITGISIIEMVEEMDAGDILYQKEIEIGEYETAEELFDKMSVLGRDCLEDVMSDIMNRNHIMKEPQDTNLVTFTHKISKEKGLIDFKTMTAQEIKNLVYGLNSWPSAYIVSNDITYKIHRVVFGKKDMIENAGKIVEISKDGIEVVCGDGNTLIITEIQKQGKKKMDGYTFSNGQHLKVGDTFQKI